MTARSLRAAALSLLLVACAPEPADVVVLVFDQVSQRYQPQRVTLTTVDDIVAMKGSVARIVGEAEFTVAADDPALARAGDDRDRQRKAITKDAGTPVKVSWIKQDGALVPADFHSLNIATTYYNFERAFRFFEQIGDLHTQEFPAPTVYYFPKLVFGGKTEKDNALFFPLLESFLILPFDDLQKIPLAINSGVVGHEYSHSIFNYRVFDRDPFAIYETWGSDLRGTPGLNLVTALDEGIADVFGTGITCSEDLVICDLNFIGRSLPAVHNQERRVDVPHCMTQALHDSLAQLPSDQFRADGLQYNVGSVLASAMWRAGEADPVVLRLGAGEARRQMFQALYRALAGSGEARGIRELIRDAAGDQTGFHLETRGTTQGVLDVIVQAVTDPTLKEALCRALLGRFDLKAEQLRSCDATLTPYVECPQPSP